MHKVGSPLISVELLDKILQAYPLTAINSIDKETPVEEIHRIAGQQDVVEFILRSVPFSVQEEIKYKLYLTRPVKAPSMLSRIKATFKRMIKWAD